MKRAVDNDPLWVKALTAFAGVVAGVIAFVVLWFIRDWWTHYSPWAS